MVSIFKVKHSKTLVLFSIFLSASIATVLLKAKTYGKKKKKNLKKSLPCQMTSPSLSSEICIRIP